MNRSEFHNEGVDSQTLGWYANNAAQVAASYQQVSCDSQLFAAISAFAFEAAATERPRVLDIGCGSGRDLAWWEAQGAICSGLDACHEMLAQAKQLNPGLCGKLYHDTLPRLANSSSHSYDVLFCSAVLMHLPLQALDEAAQSFKRLLKPGGKLIVSIPLQGPQLDEEFRSVADGRLFSPLQEQLLSQSLGAQGFVLVTQYQTDDSLGRNQRSWLTLMYKLA